ncbi:hypothetical protein chiPu_0005825, partial [Chiloscyllium punctatum]|nr:hypothetical protein [Chiloscyllium punctatum]
ATHPQNLNFLHLPFLAQNRERTATMESAASGTPLFFCFSRDRGSDLGFSISQGKHSPLAFFHFSLWNSGGTIMEMQAVNSMSYEQFIDVFGNVIEKCPLIAAAVWTKRPFPSVSALEQNFADFIDSLPRSGKEGILRCHPDLAGRDLLRGTLSLESQAEQNQAGLTTLTAGQRSQLSELNAAYKNKFHFPFVICARMNDRESITHQLSSRIRNSPEQELQISIKEVLKICHLRLLDIIRPAARSTKL